MKFKKWLKELKEYYGGSASNPSGAEPPVGQNVIGALKTYEVKNKKIKNKKVSKKIRF